MATTGAKANANTKTATNTKPTTNTNTNTYTKPNNNTNTNTNAKNSNTAKKTDTAKSQGPRGNNRKDSPKGKGRHGSRGSPRGHGRNDSRGSPRGHGRHDSRGSPRGHGRHGSMGSKQSHGRYDSRHSRRTGGRETESRKSSVDESPEFEQDDGTYSMVINCRGGKLYCHKDFLSIWSSVFNKLCNPPVPEPTEVDSHSDKEDDNDADANSNRNDTSSRYDDPIGKAKTKANEQVNKGRGGVNQGVNNRGGNKFDKQPDTVSMRSKQDSIITQEHNEDGLNNEGMFELDLEDEKSDFKKLLQCLYEFHEVSEKNVDSVLPLAHEYEFEQLKSKCEEFIITSRTSDLELLLTSQTYKLWKLREKVCNDLCTVHSAIIKRSPEYEFIDHDSKMMLFKARCQHLEAQQDEMDEIAEKQYELMKFVVRKHKCKTLPEDKFGSLTQFNRDARGRRVKETLDGAAYLKIGEMESGCRGCLMSLGKTGASKIGALDEKKTFEMFRQEEVDRKNIHFHSTIVNSGRKYQFDPWKCQFA